MTRQLLVESFQSEMGDLMTALKTWSFYRALLVTAVGVVLVGVAVNGILVPFKYFAGGITGLALIIYYASGWESLPLIFWTISVPIFIVGWRAISLRYMVLAILGTLLCTGALELTRDVQVPTRDPIMAAVLAGVLIGLGVGSYLRFGGSTGGMDIVAAVIKKKFAIPMGNTFITVNVLVLLAGMVLYSLDIALYTGICMYVTSYVVERVQTGFSQRRSVFIISEQPHVIADLIHVRLDRGVTYFRGYGAYAGKETLIVYTVINMVELGRLKEIIYHTDPDAFVAVSNTAEVIGRRFLSWEDEGYQRQSRRAA